MTEATEALEGSGCPPPYRFVRCLIPLVVSVVAWSPAEARPVRVVAGSDHTCMLTRDGGVKCWGFNGYGQLGDASYVSRSTPGDVVSSTSNVIGLSAGMHHTCALLHGGTLKCWGRNDSGQAGSSEYNVPMPTAVSGLPSDVVAIGTGSMHTCAVRAGGEIRCWGDNRNGQLGDGTTTNRTAPAAVVALDGPAVAVAAGGFHSCAVMATGIVKCWGEQRGPAWRRDDGETSDASCRFRRFGSHRCRGGRRAHLCHRSRRRGEVLGLQRVGRTGRRDGRVRQMERNAGERLRNVERRVDGGGGPRVQLCGRRRWRRQVLGLEQRGPGWRRDDERPARVRPRWSGWVVA